MLLAAGFQRLEQASVNQGGDVMGLTVQHPPRLLRRQAGRKLAQERQKPVLIVFHTPYQSQAAQKANRQFDSILRWQSGCWTHLQAMLNWRA